MQFYATKTWNNDLLQKNNHSSVIPPNDFKVIIKTFNILTIYHICM